MFGSSSLGQKSSLLGSKNTNISKTSTGSQNSSPASSTSSVFAPSSSPAFRTSPAFERNTTEFGHKQKPGLASPTTSFCESFQQTRPAFCAPRTQEFGYTTSNTTAFGTSTCPFRAQSSPSSESFSDSSTSRSSPSSGKSAASPFGFPSKFGPSKLGGNRAVPYAQTVEWDPISHEPVMFQSISAMKAYKERSHEELRWENYCRGEKTQTASDAGFSSSDLGNNRQSEMRRKEKLERYQKINERTRLAETLDTEIKRWASGKEGNLRALLSTLQYILGFESGWKPITLTDRSTSVEVKKAYRQATLHVHPDKLQQRGASSRQKYICERVFQLLQVAWSKFNR